MPYSQFSFSFQAQDRFSSARCGLLKTPHGALKTPNFIFCATRGSLKSATTVQAQQAGAQILLSNTYHLMLSPGADWVQRAGGLHQVLNWNGPLLTDSGGFQIFSLGHGGVVDEIKGRQRKGFTKTLLRIKEAGAIFRSYIDGSYHMLTPERSIEVQQKLGADLILVLDECTPYASDRHYTQKSMDRSHRWGERSLKAFWDHTQGTQALYGIIQGGVYSDLRQESAYWVGEKSFFGQAIGGTLGGSVEEMYTIVRYTTQQMNRERPMHLLGIGGLRDILHGVACGIDTFDCVHPTRLARHGCALIDPPLDGTKEHINLRNSQYKEDFEPISLECHCEACRSYTKAYLHYLFKAKESLGGQLLAIHNIHFMSQWMQKIRQAIQQEKFSDLLKMYGISW